MCSDLVSCVQPGPVLGLLPHPLHPLPMVPRIKPSAVLGQKRCKAISTLVWFPGTGVTPKGCPKQGLELPTALCYCRDRACSWGGWIAVWGPGRSLRQAGFTSVIWVTDKVTLGRCLCVTTGFLRSSAASAATRFQILPSGTEPKTRYPSLRGTRSSHLALPMSPAFPVTPWGGLAAHAKEDVQVRPCGLAARGLDFPSAWRDGLGEVASTVKVVTF